MTWSPPLIRTARQVNVICSHMFPDCLLWAKRTLLLLLVFCCASGCGSLVAVRQSVDTARLARIDQLVADLPDEPVFDQQPVATRRATSRPIPELITASKPFAWQREGQSAGGLPFEIFRSGHEGFRTLVVGSVGGHDPVAVRLVDELARHLHQQQAILGGFQTVVIRTLNPDGAKSGSYLNAGGKYVNHHFPSRLPSTGSLERRDVPEVAFGLNQIHSTRPRRIIHVRSIQSEQGVIATDPAAASAAQEIADWQSFVLKPLPATAASGSLEQCVSQSGDLQMLTVAIPHTTPVDQVWSLYGDSLLNLLLSDDFQSRELARQRKHSSSANARFRNPAQP